MKIQFRIPPSLSDTGRWWLASIANVDHFFAGAHSAAKMSLPETARGIPSPAAMATWGEMAAAARSVVESGLTQLAGEWIAHPVATTIAAATILWWCIESVVQTLTASRWFSSRAGRASTWWGSRRGPLPPSS